MSIWLIRWASSILVTNVTIDDFNRQIYIITSRQPRQRGRQMLSTHRAQQVPSNLLLSNNSLSSNTTIKLRSSCRQVVYRIRIILTANLVGKCNLWMIGCSATIQIPICTRLCKMHRWISLEIAILQRISSVQEPRTGQILIMEARINKL